MRNYFPKRPLGAPLHTLSKLYDVPVGFVTPPYFEAEYCFFCGRRMVAVARYRMICLVLTFFSWLDLIGDVLAFRISILKIFKLVPNY